MMGLEDIFKKAGGFEDAPTDDNNSSNISDDNKGDQNQGADDKSGDVILNTDDVGGASDGADDGGNKDKLKTDDDSNSSDGSLNPPADGDGAKKLPEDSGQTVEVDFNKLLAENSSGRFNSISEIDKALESVDVKFATDQVAKLNEYLLAGGKFNDFAQTQTADYFKMSDLDVLREAKALQNPNLSKDDIELLLEEDYGVNSKSSDRDRRLAQIRVKQDANNGRNVLLENQEKWAVPQVTNEQQTALQKEQQEKWEASFNAAQKNVSEVSFKLNEKDTFNLKVEDKLKETVSKYKDVSEFFKRYQNADGTENVEKFIQDMFILENLSLVSTSIAAQSKSSGTEKVVKDLNNPDFTKGGSGSGSGNDDASVQGQAFKAFFGQK